MKLPLLKLLFLLVFCCLAATSFAQTNNAIINNNSFLCEVEKNASLSVTRNIEISIFNNLGAEMVNIPVFYDDMTEIENFEVIVADIHGKKIKKLKQSDFEDFTTSHSVFYSTGRVVLINASHNVFPYKLIVHYSYRTKSFFSFPVWNPKLYANFPVEKSSYTILAPKEYEVNSGFKNFLTTYTVDTLDAKCKQSWTCKNLPYLYEEKYSTPLSWLTPIGYFSPYKFSYANVDGGFARWSEFGKWNYDICSTRKQLPKEEIEVLKELTKHCQNKKDTIRALYKHLQETTRYVSITIEEGGFVPFDAEFVCTKKYGDCKALSNYMSAMLQAFGIESYYCIINAGADAAPIDTSIIASQFNHVILMVPLHTDSIWLECTSSEFPAGFLGTFTEDRYCLVTKAEGSKFVKTPCSSANANITKTLAVARYINDTLLYKSSTNNKGINAASDIFLAMRPSKKDIADRIITLLNFKLDDESIQLSTSREAVESTIEINASVRAKTRVYGSNVFVSQINKIQEAEIVSIKAKNYPFTISHNQGILDSTHYVFDGFKVDAIPESTTITSIFGAYRLYSTQDAGTVTIKKELVLNKAIYKPELFKEYMNFLQQINDSEDQLIIVSKND